MISKHLLDVDIECGTFIRADPDRVWRSLTTADGVNQWFTSGSTWTHEIGSAMNWRWENWGIDQISTASIGKVLEVEPCERFVFSWSNGSGPEPSIVTMTFTPQEDGTKVELVDSGYPDSPAGRRALMDCACGWGEALTLAKVFVEHGIIY